MHANLGTEMRALTRGLELVLILCAAALSSGCNSPTLPLPPPAPPAVQSVTLLNGQAVIKGGNYAVEPLARVFCLNQANSNLAQDDADSHGAYLLSLPAQAGNKVECWQQVDYQVSDRTSVIVQP